MKEKTKARLKQAERLGKTVGVEFKLFEIRGFRRETLIQFLGPITKFWVFVEETLGGFK